jgi:hypothetical protein
MVSTPIAMEFVLTSPLQHNRLYRVLLRATDAAGNVAVNGTGCVLVDKTKPVVTLGAFNASQVTSVNGVPYLLDGVGADRTLTLTATVDNDVSGLASVSVCCGSIEQTCDINTASAVTLSPGLDPQAPPTSVNVTTRLPVGSNLDGFQVCCTVRGSWPIPGHFAVSASSPCVRVDFTRPQSGVVTDGPLASGTRYFSGSTVYAQWEGFVDPNGGTIVSYQVGLSTNSDASVPPNVAPWRNVGLQLYTAFTNLTLVQGATYYAVVAAIDAVGHVGVTTRSPGQVYDSTPPVVAAGDVTQVAQKEPNAAAAMNLQYASDPGYVIVRCPKCTDDTSGIGSGGCTLNTTSTPTTRRFGSSWTNDAFVMGLQTPLVDTTSYAITCECYNGELPTTATTTTATFLCQLRLLYAVSHCVSCACCTVG